MKICIVGSGYVGLTTAVCLAEIGHEVMCCDINEMHITSLKKGVVPIHEPGMSELIKKHTAKNKERLFFSHHVKDAIMYSEIIFICVNTPLNDDNTTDMSNIWDVAKQIGENLNDYKVVIQKSTVPVGTAAQIKNIIRKNRVAPIDFDVVANPGFSREGTAVLDFLNGDRIIIGCDSWKGTEKLIELYSPLPSRIIVTSPESAELIKYATNSFLSMKISYINSIAKICEKIGADKSS